MDISLLYQLFLISDGIATDSRKSVEGKMFFALKGVNFDGSNFIDSVIESGASCVVTCNPNWQGQTKIVYVEDVLTTLQHLANYHRKELDIPVLAITGSNGKTTTKELIHFVLSQKYNVHSTSGNFNNLIGLPLTILQANLSHEIMVLEMGSNALGEIAQLCTIAEPDFGLITNIGPAHLEGFGNVAGVLREKTELYRSVISHGGLIFVPGQSKQLLESTVSYSNRQIFDISSEPMDAEKAYHLQIDTTLPHLTGQVADGELAFPFQSVLFGEHNAQNCAAASAIGRHFKVNGQQIAQGLNNYTPNNNRSQIIKSGRTTIILDAYNANPISMEKALDMLDNWPEVEKVAILGDMKELGEHARSAHDSIVSRVKNAGYKSVFFVGSEFGLSTDQVFLSVEALGEYLVGKQDELDNTVILIKGSRSMGLEKILPYLSIDMEQI